MEKAKSRLIIIEGPQGSGKTNLAEALRENIPSSDLYRLSGIKDKTMAGLSKSNNRYNVLLDYLKFQEENGLEQIFDRMFFSEQVYANLGFKEYDYTETFQKLVKKFVSLNYDVYYFSLYLENTATFETRLARDLHHTYQTFSIENSIKQQEEYAKVANYMKQFENVKVYEIATDNFQKAYEKIGEILDVKLIK